MKSVALKIPLDETFLTHCDSLEIFQKALDMPATQSRPQNHKMLWVGRALKIIQFQGRPVGRDIFH